MAMRLLFLLLSLTLGGAAFAQTQSQQVPQDENRIKAQQERAVTQPGNNAPVWREVRSGGAGPYTTTSARGRETDVLIQSWGDTWRRIRNGPVTFYGGWFVVIVVAAILGFYAWKGPVRMTEPPTGRQLRRFTPFEMV